MFHRLRFKFHISPTRGLQSLFTRYALRFTSYVLRFTSHLDSGLLIAALLTLFAIQPLLKPGLPTIADLMIHMVRAAEFERAWATGVMIPRWAPNLAYGYGYPLFIFAPPLPYLLVLAFQLPGVTLEFAFKILIIVTFLLYAIGIYLLVRDLLGSVGAGLVAAAAYTCAPFALREALLYGGNIPQFLAIGLFPWPLWAITRAVRTNSWGWTMVAALCYAGIILSHLFQALIFSPVFGVYSLLLLLENKVSLQSVRARLFNLACKTMAAIPIGLLLSAFFWLPVFMERGETRAQADIYLEKSPFFVRYPYWPELVAWIQPLDFRAANPYAPLTLGVITLILAGLGIVRGLSSFNNKDFGVEALAGEPPPEGSTPVSWFRPLMTLFFVFVAAGAIFMTLPVSRPVWETVEILQVAEFPWRMLGPANLGLAVLAGMAGLWWPRPVRSIAVALCLAIQLWAVGPYLYPVTAFSQHGPLTLADQITYERSSQSIGTTTLGEYLPKSVTRTPTTSPLAAAFQAGHSPERLDRAALPAQATATLLAQTAITHRYRVNSPVPFTLRLFQFDFPGWRADLDGQPVEIRPETESGLILIDIPAGQHSLTIHFGETIARLLGLGLSGVTFVGLAIIGIAGFKRRREKTASETLAGEEARLPLKPWPTGMVLLAIIIAALWLKPLLQPFFTISSPQEQILPAQHQTSVHFTGGIHLVGYDLSDRVAPPGGYLQVVLYWQADQAPYRVNLQPFVHLDRLDNFETAADATNYTPGDVTTEMNMPTFHWDNSRYIRDEHDLLIPADIPPLAYAVRVGLIDPDRQGQLVALAGAGGDTAWLDTINISPAPGSPTPALAQPLNILFSNDRDAIRLTGFEMVTLTPTELQFKLMWETAQRPQANYTVFAQLLDINKQLAASFDGPPLSGAYPTGTWLPDQPILDPRSIPLAAVSPGDYTLIVGLYDPTTGRRLMTPEGIDFALLTTVTKTD